MFSTIFSKTLYGLRWQFFGWFVAIFFTAFITMVMYPSFSQAGIESLVDSVPESLKSFVGNASDFNTVPGFIGQQVFGPNLYIISIIMAILIFIAISASEESDGRLQSLLALPVSRSQVYLEKYFAAMLIVSALSLSVIAAIGLSLFAIGESADLWRIIQSAIGFTLLNVAYGTIAFAAAMFTGNKSITLLIVSGYAVASLFVSNLAPAVDKLAFVDKFSLIHYYNNPQTMTNGLEISNVLTMLAVIVALGAIGLVGFTRRDIKAN